MENITKILGAINSDTTTLGVSLVICALFILAITALLINHLANKSYLSTYTRSAPGILTTIGVFGTFWGILLGLLDFNVTTIDKSVPLLLAGLKVSFATSIVGIFLSVTLKLMQAIFPSTKSSVGVTAGDLHDVLSDIRKYTKNAAVDQKQALEELRLSISSDKDMSLLSQIQKMRTDIKDGQNDLIQAFNKFAEKVAEANSSALIDALKEVINDFNAKINEQFGENFKQLNEAVGALLTWQDNYREHVEKLEQRIGFAVESVETSASALNTVKEHAGAIPATIEPLGPLLTGLQQQTDSLSEHLEAFSDLRNNAVEAFPVIDANLKRITDQLADSVQASISETQASLKSQRATFNELGSGFEDLREHASDTQKVFIEQLNGSLAEMNQQSSQALEEQRNQIDITARSMEKQIAESWDKTQETINNYLKQITDELTESVKASILETNKSVESQRMAFNELNGGFKDLREHASDTQKVFIDKLSSSLTEMNQQANRALEEQRNQIDITARSMEKQINEAWSKTENAINDQMSALDKQMQEELSRAIASMGQNLASLSEKFVGDYTPLTNQLREVVQLAKRLG